MAFGRRPDDAISRAEYDQIIARLDRQHGRLLEVEREVTRLSPQVAAIEARIEDLRQAVERAAVPAGDQATVAEALARIEQEHERVRARISAAARFEERLRVLEESSDRG